jgi:hypothetical protein
MSARKISQNIPRAVESASIGLLARVPKYSFLTSRSLSSASNLLPPEGAARTRRQLAEYVFTLWLMGYSPTTYRVRFARLRQVLRGLLWGFAGY